MADTPLHSSQTAFQVYLQVFKSITQAAEADLTGREWSVLREILVMQFAPDDDPIASRKALSPTPR
jgi:hypothetical protein